jgi:hypothetical protein
LGRFQSIEELWNHPARALKSAGKSSKIIRAVTLLTVLTVLTLLTLSTLLTLVMPTIKSSQYLLPSRALTGS